MHNIKKYLIDNIITLKLNNSVGRGKGGRGRMGMRAAIHLMSIKAPEWGLGVIPGKAASPPAYPRLLSHPDNLNLPSVKYT
jgi:hypothetical protein